MSDGQSSDLIWSALLPRPTSGRPRSVAVRRPILVSATGSDRYLVRAVGLMSLKRAIRGRRGRLVRSDSLSMLRLSPGLPGLQPGPRRSDVPAVPGEAPPRQSLRVAAALSVLSPAILHRETLAAFFRRPAPQASMLRPAAGPAAALARLRAAVGCGAARISRSRRAQGESASGRHRSGHPRRSSLRPQRLALVKTVSHAGAAGLRCGLREALCFEHHDFSKKIAPRRSASSYYLSSILTLAHLEPSLVFVRAELFACAAARGTFEPPVRVPRRISCSWTHLSRTGFLLRSNPPR